MEETLNKKTILILFIISLGIFLFVYKGLFTSGDIYRFEYENFRLSLSSHNNTSFKMEKIIKIKFLLNILLLIMD